MKKFNLEAFKRDEVALKNLSNVQVQEAQLWCFILIAFQVILIVLGGMVIRTIKIIINV